MRSRVLAAILATRKLPVIDRVFVPCPQGGIVLLHIDFLTCRFDRKTDCHFPSCWGTALMTIRRTLALFVSTLLIGPCVSAENPPSMQVQAKAAVSTTQGKLKLRGLQEPVNVLRDRWGVAHIYAQNQHDLFFAQGFVVAQDRLFQMELWKAPAKAALRKFWVRQRFRAI